MTAAGKQIAIVSSLTLVYFIVSFVGIMKHELWLDESHHWLLARDSETVSDFFWNTRFEGHPVLWDFLLFAITRFTQNPFAMQVLHILISTSAIFVFLRNARFSWVFKILFIFGYFMLFEYNLISRNYILGILFLFAACSYFENQNKHLIKICVFLALAANVHLMFSVISMALIIMIAYDDYHRKKFFSRKQFIGYSIFLIGMLLTMLQMLKTDSGWFFDTLKDIPIGERFTKGFISLYKGIFTVPDFTTIHFWNTNLFVNLSKSLSAVAGLLLYYLPLVLFFRNKKLLLYIYSALIFTQIFFYVTQRSATRFDGINYIILVIALWIDGYNKINIMEHSPKRMIIYGILLVHFFSGIAAYVMDYRYPFTTAKAVTDYLKEKRMDRADIISVTCDGTLLSPYLGKKIFFLCDGSEQSYCHWDFNCAENITQSKIVGLLSLALKEDYAVYVSNYSLLTDLSTSEWKTINDKFRVRFLKKFDQSIIRNCDYYVFEVSKIQQGVSYEK